jgi:hypothetical protein
MSIPEGFLLIADNSLKSEYDDCSCSLKVKEYLRRTR